ncbi:hypothetical protein FGB62_76g0105 [Gracilaria domingensis]|nr:hypothetical protein FGB62_76g0105 [Gracilaria domingensis]
MHPRTKCVGVYIALLLSLHILSKLIQAGQASIEHPLIASKPINTSSIARGKENIQRNNALNAFSTSVRASNSEKPSILQRVATWFKQVFPFRSSSKQDDMASDVIPSSSRSSQPDFHQTRVADVDVAYNNPFTPRAIRGVALLFHGCSQSAKDWFQLPEHRIISSHLLKRRFALLALTSQNRVTGCWSTRFPARENDDVARVKIAVRQWTAEQGLPPSTPLIAVGISSGATMLSILSLDFPIRSQALYISPGNQRALRNATSQYPSTLFVHLESDHYYAPMSSIAASRRILVRKRVAMVGELSLESVPFTATTFHEHEPRLTKKASQRIYEAAGQNVQTVAQVIRANRLSDEKLQRSATQIARVLRGAHEVSAMHVDKITKWLVTQSSNSEKHE